MPYDGLVTAAMRSELEAKLTNARVDKVHQPNRDEIVISLRQPGDGFRLLLSSHPAYPRVHLTESSKGNPADAFPFCMVLRKHLIRARLLCVTQPHFDRILKLHFETYDDFQRVSSVVLITEIMGRHSNVILVDATTGTIIDSLRHVSDDVSRVREVLPGRTYFEPPNQNRLDPREVSHDFFVNLILSGDETKVLGKTLLTNFTGLSPIVCKELALRAGLSAETPKGALGPDDAGRLWDAFSGVLDEVSSSTLSPRLYRAESTRRPEDFSAVPLTVYEDLYEESPFESISSLVDLFYTQKDARERLDQKKAELRRVLRHHIERCDRKLALQEGAKRDAENSHVLRIQGDVLMANLWQLTKRASSVSLPNLYSETMEPISIPLDPSMSGLDNAQRYYRKYARSRNSMAAVEEQIAKTWDEATYLGHVEVAVDTAGSDAEVQEIREELSAGGYVKQARKGRTKSTKGGKVGGKGRSLPTSQPMRFRTADGFEVLVGKNNRQNDNLTMKVAGPSDLWFHTKDIPGSHVILRTAGTPLSGIPEGSLLEAATLAAAYSKGRASSNVPVDYTLRKHVRKPAGAKPGMVIYDSQRTVYVTPPPPEPET